MKENWLSILTNEDHAPPYIIDEILLQGDFLLFAAGEGVGKSLFWYHAAMCIATGLPCLGRSTVKGKVLYFDEENGVIHGGEYARRLWRGLGEPDVNLLQENFHLERGSLSRHGNQRYDYMEQLVGVLQPLLIVIDTASSALGIKDENDNAEASAAVTHLRKVLLLAGPQCALILLKHTREDEKGNTTKILRGAKVWKGALDGTLSLTKCAGRPRDDRLFNTLLSQDKLRAYGLLAPIVIHPSRTGNAPCLGIRLDPKNI